MANHGLIAPQLVLHSRMLYTSWIPEDPDACARLLPKALKPAKNRAVYMNQYVVDSAEQTTGFGAYSLTYLGVDVAGHDVPNSATPGRFFTHYFNSAEGMREYARERGVPAAPGRTTLELEGGTLTATTFVDGAPIIRSRAEVSSDTFVLAGHLRYITVVRDRLVSGFYPYIGDLVSQFRVTSIEFLEPNHPVYALRPASPLEIVPAASFFAPRDSFVYPGGEEDLGPAKD
ncbi:MAG TPA: hypothetical protein VFX98_13895 [Longimicrobiaceae bacterium]|nr:hypothetical protein [Longimicrobiaceae bacterium]